MSKNRLFLLLIGDILAILGAFWAIISIRSKITGSLIPIENFFLPFLILIIVWLLILFVFNFYEKELIKTTPRNIGLLGIAWTFNILSGVLIFYFFPPENIAPKLTLLAAGVMAFGLVTIWRRIFYKLFSYFLTINIIVIGKKETTVEFIKEIEKNHLVGKIVGYFEKADDERILENRKVDIIVSESENIEKIIQLGQKINSKIMSIEEAYEKLFAKIPISQMNDSVAINIAANRISFANWIFNKIFDRLIAIIILIASSPFLLFAIIAILIEDGKPFIYSQDRVGKNNRIFKLYKLRSMIKNSEESGAIWAEKDDSRITKVGRIIRKLHIDEIPQMWNILKGDLSLIGPRPERPEFVEKLEKEIPYYYLRHIIRPGFTGWAQIKFRYARSVEDSKEKFEYDLYYLKNRGLVFDMGIFLKTIQVIFTH